MKITIAMRNSILQKELTKKFHDDLAKAEKDLIEEVEKELVKTIKKIPKELIDERYVRVESTVEIEIEGERRSKSIEVYNSYPITWDSYSHKMKPTAKIKSLLAKEKALKDARDKFKADLRRILDGFNTHKNLVANVPEFQEYFTNLETAQSMAIIPYEQIKEVRKQLAKR